MEKINEKTIREVASSIGKAARAQKVILFGSHARGSGGRESDVDFLVVSQSALPRHKRSRALYALFDPYPFPMDIIVYTPEEIQEGLEHPGSFIANALSEGKEVYAG
jgi:predicted nucleotidyltransferase